MSIIKSCDFEVYGKVQKVFFRKYTKKQANILGITGWIMNTQNQTVKGIIEGPDQSVAEMKNWLQKVGSPKSNIERASFNNEKIILKKNYTQFLIKG